jgi:hypothetical protein
MNRKENFKKLPKIVKYRINSFVYHFGTILFLKSVNRMKNNDEMREYIAMSCCANLYIHLCDSGFKVDPRHTDLAQEYCEVVAKNFVTDLQSPDDAFVRHYEDMLTDLEK